MDNLVCVFCGEPVTQKNCVFLRQVMYDGVKDFEAGPPWARYRVQTIAKKPGKLIVHHAVCSLPDGALYSAVEPVFCVKEIP